MRVRFGECVLDSETRQLSVGGTTDHMQPKAFQFLELLLETRPKAVSKQQIHERLWPGTFVSDGTLTSLLVEVRNVIGDDARHPIYVRTVHGFGYAFCGEAGKKAKSPVPAPRGAGPAGSCMRASARPFSRAKPSSDGIRQPLYLSTIRAFPAATRGSSSRTEAPRSRTSAARTARAGRPEDRIDGRPFRRRPHRRRNGRADVPDASHAPFDRNRRRVVAASARRRPKARD